MLYGTEVFKYFTLNWREFDLIGLIKSDKKSTCQQSFYISGDDLIDFDPSRIDHKLGRLLKTSQSINH